MKWDVAFTRKAEKQSKGLPKYIKETLYLLVKDIQENGPVRGNWQNYGKLGDNRHHCHLKKGSPTYVAVWEVSVKQVRFVEVCYVGTHEKAPY
jgi:mRNA-degrading endonuclease RelE of RelBE toxin-antitoxin system